MVRKLACLWNGTGAARSAASTGPSDELHDNKTLLAGGLLLAFPVLVLQWDLICFRLENTVPPRVQHMAALLLASPVVLWCGWPFFARAGMSLRNRSLNMFTLVAMGTGVTGFCKRHYRRLYGFLHRSETYGWHSGRLF